ncbi:MAG TPA: undecaprenyldiphospho-muramoylpentapeptide beta-N-acetylglucosaminyltransferase [Nevskiaceae bacterium]|nr:undecaprenyldiphospho-muramoylpentapeptide beta-N-acetylglucosaminyltransferase [Nevskiaceae bacterium]
MKALIMAGGTGGHVFPALAVAEVLRARGHEVVWMGAPESFEARVVPQQGYRVEFVRVSGLRGKGAMKLLLAPLLLLRALIDALAALRRVRPDFVLGMGGFASGPGGIAAWLSRKPLLIHEQNAAAGMTNRLLARIATRVLEAFPRTFAGAVTVGNPVRRGFAELPAPEQRLQHDGRARLLVIGGSQGARALNQLVPQALALVPREQRPQLRHQAGRTLELAQRSYAATDVEVSLEQFINDMPAAFAWADLVICRAGASTIAEISAAGCAALLVPFPAAVDDHQTRNGEYLVRAGAALLLPESTLTPQLLAQTLTALLADRAKLISMARAARTCAWNDAAGRIAQLCLQTAGAAA